MGVAATHRGDAVIRRHLDEQIAGERLRDNMIRAIEAEEQANAWRREICGAAAEAIARGGLLGGILAKHGRVWESRMRHVNAALIRWQDARDMFDRADAAIAYAAAVYRLYDWARGMFRFPLLDAAPRHVRLRARRPA